jgi:glucokinase
LSAPKNSTIRVLAVDLGGTKLSVAVVDEAGTILHLLKLPSTQSLTEIAEAAGEAVERAGLAWTDIQAAGMIVPGIYNPRTRSAWTPNVWGMDEVPIGDELQRLIPVPLRISSDRTGYVLGESWIGIARGLSDVVFLAIGTGIGAGILSGGRVIEGYTGVAGAVGWFSLSTEFKEAYQRMGCWESEAAGPAFAHKAGTSTAEEAVIGARAGDANALRAAAETAEFIGAGVANLISALNPEMVVLGGGLMQAGDLFLEPIRASAARWAQPVSFRHARIELTTLGEHAGLLGAARLAFSKE